MPQQYIRMAVAFAAVAVSFIIQTLARMWTTCTDPRADTRTGGARRSHTKRTVDKPLASPGTENFTERDLQIWCDANRAALGGAEASRTETLCRAAFAKILYQTDPDLSTASRAVLKSAKPDWLTYITQTGVRIALEIDGLDAEPREFNGRRIRIAFEYDGPQHTSFESFCRMARVAETSWAALDFYRQRYYDRVKTDLCTKHGVELIRISNAPRDDMLHAVFRALAALWARSATVGHAIDTPAVDDADIISRLTNLDFRRSEAFPELRFETGAGRAIVLKLASRDWTPHPYLDRTSMYYRLFRGDLEEFCSRLNDMYNTARYERAKAPALERYLAAAVRHAGERLRAVAIDEQARDVQHALERTVKKIVAEACVL